MPARTSTIELRKMSAADLRKEIESHRLAVAKKKMTVEMKSEKNTAAYRIEKRDLARMITILAEIERGTESKIPTKTLKATAKTSKVSARAKSDKESTSTAA